jgi:hypothetical protein
VDDNPNLETEVSHSGSNDSGLEIKVNSETDALIPRKMGFFKKANDQIKKHKLLSFWGIRTIVNEPFNLLSAGVAYMTISTFELQNHFAFMGNYALPFTAATTSGATRLAVDPLISPVVYLITKERYQTETGRGIKEFGINMFTFIGLGKVVEIGTSTLIYAAMLNAGWSKDLGFVVSGKLAAVPTVILETMMYDWIILRENPLVRAKQVGAIAGKKVLQSADYLADRMLSAVDKIGPYKYRYN